jgi:O-antigen ligase
MRLYEKSFETLLNNSPAIGLGQKPFLDFDIPLGSHSSYLGFIVKFGIFGLIFELIMLYYFFMNLLRAYLTHNHQNFYINLIIISVLALFITEDVDSTSLNAILLGFMVGYFLHNNHRRRA